MFDVDKLFISSLCVFFFLVCEYVSSGVQSAIVNSERKIGDKMSSNATQTMFNMPCVDS